ncbi:MAG: hypothetical protein DHS20C18_52450 [Saprospiraceae bacterium]|nr:MAG: hypothetical protein DHS20C18_52450 [Saprospiraceae bacterium]
MERYAVIDLGTNTFHLKIIELLADGSLMEYYRDRQFVRLGEQGIDTLGSAAYQRGIDTILHFHQILVPLQVKQLRAMGTAALRTATNGATFIEEIFQKTGIAVELITGDEEARLIYEGVRHAVPLQEAPDLIMDIGGGSVEFILANQTGIIKIWSFPVGMSVLYRKFHRHDPLLAEEAVALRQFLDGVFMPMLASIKAYNIHRLVGASGTFEVLANMLPTTLLDQKHYQVNIQALLQLIPPLLYTTKEQRMIMSTLPSERADMIVVAFLLIEYMLTNIPFDQVMVSEYALREGVLWSMVEGRVEL